MTYFGINWVNKNQTEGFCPELTYLLTLFTRFPAHVVALVRETNINTTAIRCIDTDCKSNQQLLDQLTLLQILMNVDQLKLH